MFSGKELKENPLRLVFLVVVWIISAVICFHILPVFIGLGFSVVVCIITIVLLPLVMELFISELEHIRLQQ